MLCTRYESTWYLVSTYGCRKLQNCPSKQKFSHLNFHCTICAVYSTMFGFCEVLQLFNVLLPVTKLGHLQWLKWNDNGMSCRDVLSCRFKQKAERCFGGVFRWSWTVQTAGRGGPLNNIQISLLDRLICSRYLNVMVIVFTWIAAVTFQPFFGCIFCIS